MTRSDRNRGQRALGVAAATFALLLAAACGGADTEPADEAGMPAAEAPAAAEPQPALPMGGAADTDAALTDEDRAAIADVTQRVSSLTSPQAAIDAGFTDQHPEGCASSPDGQGAQGIHYLNPSRLDAQVNVQEPELVMYEPQADGSHQLVGVDYVIPFDQWTAAEPPTLLGRPLMRNEPLGVWAIHIWTHRENPSGIFAAWNPNVSCENAM